MPFSIDPNKFLEKSYKWVVSVCLIVLVIAVSFSLTFPQISELLGTEATENKLDGSYVTIELLTDMLAEDRTKYEKEFEELRKRIIALEQEKGVLETQKAVLEEKLRMSGERNAKLEEEIQNLNKRIDELEEIIKSLEK